MFVIAIYKIILLSNQDIYFIKHKFILRRLNLCFQALDSGLNTHGVFELSPLCFFGKKIFTTRERDYVFS